MIDEIAVLYCWLVEQQPEFRLIALCTETGGLPNPHFLVTKGSNFGNSCHHLISNELHRLIHDDFPDSGTVSHVLEYVNNLHRKHALDELINEL